MRLLLTSGGVTNDSIRDALVRLLGKAIEQATALVIPTAQWAHPACTPETAWRSIADRWEGQTGMTGLGWASVGVLELTALPSIGEARWGPWVRAADALLVEGGEAVYLGEWMRESGLAAMLPSLRETVWVGVSAGSMVLTPRIGRQFAARDPEGSDETLGVVDFSIFPHLDYPGWETNTLERARAWAAELAAPAYALDDQSAISVVDGTVAVVSEGRWERFDAR